MGSIQERLRSLEFSLLEYCIICQVFGARSEEPVDACLTEIDECDLFVGIYAYRRAFLLEFIGLEPTPLERSEELEQLRALEHGYRIRCATVAGWSAISVDVPDDVARVEARLRESGSC